MSKFEAFNVTTATYKTVGDHPVLADIFLPKNLSAGTHPLILRFHGGALVNGSRNAELFFPTWLLEYAVAKSAILISADYRMMPESSGLDILEDVDDLWKWLFTGLPLQLQTITSGQSAADFTRIMAFGESAGGYIATLLAFAHPKEIRVLVASYASLDIHGMLAHWLNRGYPTLPFPDGIVPAGFVASHIASMKPGEVVSNAQFPGPRTPLAFGLMQQGRYLEFLGDDPRLFPFQRLELEKAQGATAWPRTVLIHGVDDDSVPIEGSRAFKAKLEETKPDSRVFMVEQPGSHFFDCQMHLEEAEKWLPMKFIGKNWLLYR